MQSLCGPLKQFHTKTDRDSMNLAARSYSQEEENYWKKFYLDQYFILSYFFLVVCRLEYTTLGKKTFPRQFSMFSYKKLFSLFLARFSILVSFFLTNTQSPAVAT